MQLFRNILVCVNLSRGPELSPPTQHAIHTALWLAGECSPTLTFFSVLPSADAEAANAASKVLSLFARQAEESGSRARVVTAAGPCRD